MEFHELCLMFPQADDRTLADLAKDIAENGLNDPIIRYEGKILDGRNRYLACEKAGLKPHYVEYEGNDPFQFVVSKNLYRRHLTESQRAMLAQKVYKTLMANDDLSHKEKPTQGEIAEQFGVSLRMINNAVKVGDFSSPEVVEKIMTDDGVAVHVAVEALKEAQENTGIKATKNMPPEEKEVIQREQERILQAKQEQKVRHSLTVC